MRDQTMCRTALEVREHLSNFLSDNEALIGTSNGSVVEVGSRLMREIFESRYFFAYGEYNEINFWRVIDSARSNPAPVPMGRFDAFEVCYNPLMEDYDCRPYFK